MRTGSASGLACSQAVHANTVLHKGAAWWRTKKLHLPRNLKQGCCTFCICTCRFLEHIRIRKEGSKNWVTYPCGRWFSTSLDDCRISRTLYAGHATPLITYKVLLHTVRQRLVAICCLPCLLQVFVWLHMCPGLHTWLITWLIQSGLVAKGHVCEYLGMQVKAVTSDLRGAGTDANVYLIMHGTLGTGMRHILSSGADDFER